MATFNEGILGGFSGTVGPVVGTTWRGVPVMRSKPTQPNKKPSPAQLRNQLKFTMANAFLNPLKAFLNKSFDQPKEKRSRFDFAKSYFLKEAMIPTADAFEYDYPKILISKGPYRGLAEVSLTPQANRQLHVHWPDNSALGLAYATDALSIIGYVPATHEFISFENSAPRAAGEVTLSFPEAMEGASVVLWGTFEHLATQQFATSDYLGMLSLPTEP